MSARDLIDCCMGFICVLWLLEHLVSMSRVKAPRRNRIVRAPSIHCERNPDWRINSLQMFRRQAD